jgi:glutathione S-transferase
MADPALRPRLTPSLVRSERRWEDLKTLATLETMTESIVNLRLLASSGLRSAEVEYMRRQEARIQHILDWLEADRAAADGFMPGFFSMMDMAFIAAVAFAEARRVAPWRGRPRLEALFQHFADRPSVVSTRPVLTAPPA